MRRLPPVLLEDGCSRELLSLIRTILAACKEISFRVGQGALSGVLGSTLDENIQGETQKKLDVLSNQLLKDILLEFYALLAICQKDLLATTLVLLVLANIENIFIKNIAINIVKIHKNGMPIM